MKYSAFSTLLLIGDICRNCSYSLMKSVYSVFNCSLFDKRYSSDLNLLSACARVLPSESTSCLKGSRTTTLPSSARVTVLIKKFSAAASSPVKGGSSADSKLRNLVNCCSIDGT